MSGATISVVELAGTSADVADIPIGLDLAATALGSVQGAVFATRMAEERHLDVIAVAVVGIASGLGGGILRDLLINQMPVSLRDPSLLPTALAAALLAMALAPFINRIERLVVAVDAAALGMYLMVGLGVATERELGTVPTLFVGVMACTGGSVLRDILLQTQVAVMKVGSLYVVAAVAGGVAYVALEPRWTADTAGFVAVAVTFTVRMAALRYGWRAPRAQAISARTLRKLTRPVQRLGNP